MSLTLLVRTRGISLIGTVALLVLIGFVAASFETALQRNQLRARFDKGFTHAEALVVLVKTNMERGQPLDYGWLPEEHSIAGEHVAISRETGIITVSFPVGIEGESRNLKLLPMRKGSIAELVYSQPGLCVAPEIKWVCASRDSRFGYATLADGYASLPGGLASLPSGLAPLRCR